MSELEKISYDTMVFMRGNYKLDEVGDGKNELKFKMCRFSRRRSQNVDIML